LAPPTYRLPNAASIAFAATASVLLNRCA